MASQRRARRIIQASESNLRLPARRQRAAAECIAALDAFAGGSDNLGGGAAGSAGGGEVAPDGAGEICELWGALGKRTRMLVCP